MRDLLQLLAAALLAACTSIPSGDRGGAGEPEEAPPPPELPEWIGEVRHPDHLERPVGDRERAIADGVMALASEDFGVYSAAARRLVELGEPAVPYVGFASTREDCCEAVALRAPVVLRSILHEVAPVAIGYHFDSPYRSVRIAAIEVAGERRMTEHAPRLVGMLEDEDPEIRRSGVTALRRVTNRFFGFKAKGSSAQRARAVAKWREFWGLG